MASKGASRVTGPSLFPFLSVLFCLLGSLMFLGIAISQAALHKASGNIAMSFEPPEGGVHRRRARVVECSGGTATTSDGKWHFDIAAEQAVGASSSTEFRDFLNSLETQGSRSEYVLFLVRPDGLEAFQALGERLQDFERRTRMKIGYGKELLPFGWNVHLNDEDPDLNERIET